MLKKVIISICTTIVLSIVGVASVVDVRNKEVKSDTENQITLNETNEITDVALTETETSNEVEEVVQENIEKSQSAPPITQSTTYITPGTAENDWVTVAGTTTELATLISTGPATTSSIANSFVFSYPKRY